MFHFKFTLFLKALKNKKIYDQNQRNLTFRLTHDCQIWIFSPTKPIIINAYTQQHVYFLKTVFFRRAFVNVFRYFYFSRASSSVSGRKIPGPTRYGAQKPPPQTCTRIVVVISKQKNSALPFGIHERTRPPRPLPPGAVSRMSANGGRRELLTASNLKS